LHIDKCGNTIYGARIRNAGRVSDTDKSGIHVPADEMGHAADSDRAIPVDEVVHAWASLLRCSSKIMRKLLSSHQKGFVDFLNHETGELGGKKFDVILADRISPPMEPEELLASDGLAVELFPILGLTLTLTITLTLTVLLVLGEVQHAYEVEKGTMMVVGTHGVLVAGPASSACEGGLLRYLSYRAIGYFVTSFHRKVLHVESILRNIRSRLNQGTCKET